VQATIAANTYVVTGNAESKTVSDLMPNIMPQLGPAQLKQVMEDMAKGKGMGGLSPDQMQAMASAAAAAGGAGGDDDELPELETGATF
jgi:nascent polypeptide-associated complex subunit beta